METPPHLSFDLSRSNWFFRVKHLFGINGTSQLMDAIKSANLIFLKQTEL